MLGHRSFGEEHCTANRSSRRWLLHRVSVRVESFGLTSSVDAAWCCRLCEVSLERVDSKSALIAHEVIALTGSGSRPGSSSCWPFDVRVFSGRSAVTACVNQVAQSQLSAWPGPKTFVSGTSIEDAAARPVLAWRAVPQPRSKGLVTSVDWSRCPASSREVAKRGSAGSDRRTSWQVGRESIPGQPDVVDPHPFPCGLAQILIGCHQQPAVVCDVPLSGRVAVADRLAD